jgi:transcriptional regulator with PAS, ATPase and Fis domain
VKKTIGIISQRSGMADFYKKQLLELFGDVAEISVYNVEDQTIRSLRECDLYLSTSTSYDLMRNGWARSYLPSGSKVVQSRITFTKASLELLRTYPDGTRAMLVNQNQHMALESIAQLYHLGVSNIEFLPCYPEIDAVPDVKLAFVPGEPELVPEGVSHVVDLGCRSLTANTISEIALKIGNSFFLESAKFARYTATLATVDYSLQEISYNNLTMENKLEIILNSLEAGIVCIDEKDVVTLINRAARKLLCVSRSAILGQPVSQVLPFLPFDGAYEEGASAKSKLLSIRGVNLGVTVTQLRIQDQYLGAFATLQRFEVAESRQTSLRLQMMPHSHKARYTFEDILGKSPAICRAREIAQRMADNDAYVMIEGESGTGKELFAQAIHSASPRKDGPFLAVNCAALTESLLESELFGYADGAFTGAKKGGKAGLFECAHGGTLFLDEIETMSPALQAKLLRVLQEREIIRVGSSDPIPVNVRVLSSTNEDLFARVQGGSFRRDLYYRLNVIPLHIPTLWERREDILLLCEHFQQELGADFTLTEPVRAALLQHHWQGNVRELRNCVEYLQYMNHQLIVCEDLPEQFHLQDTAPQGQPEVPGLDGFLPQEARVLQVLGELYLERRGIGRQGLVRACLARGYAISEHEVRLVLNSLQEKGYLRIGRGRGGTQLTESGFLRYREAVNGTLV